MRFYSNMAWLREERQLIRTLLRRVCCLLTAWPALTAAHAAPVPVIFDTDMDSDVDDVAALCQLHAMADLGEAELLAVMISGRNEWSGGCVDALNTFYGRP